MTRDEILTVAMSAFKDKEILFPDSPGLTWLRTPMTRVIDQILPAEEDVRELARTVDGYFSEYGTPEQLLACERVLAMLGADLTDLYR